ncbi:MAG: hypothetical protein ABI721_01320 [Candidatus Dojkabacteria bacterium]
MSNTIRPFWETENQDLLSALSHLFNTTPENAEKISNVIGKTYEFYRILRGTLNSSDNFEQDSKLVLHISKKIQNKLLEFTSNPEKESDILDLIQEYLEEFKSEGYEPFANTNINAMTQTIINFSYYMKKDIKDFISVLFWTILDKTKSLNYRAKKFEKFLMDNNIRRIRFVGPLASGTVELLIVNSIFRNLPDQLVKYLKIPSGITVEYDPMVFMSSDPNSKNYQKVALPSDLKEGDVIIVIDDGFSQRRAKEIEAYLPANVLLYHTLTER